MRRIHTRFSHPDNGKHFWFRGNEARFRPRKTDLLSPEAVKDSILDGWIPGAPVIDKRKPIVTFGSCFAGNISRHLDGVGFNLLTAHSLTPSNIYVVVCNEGIVNTFTMRQMFEWVYLKRAPIEPLWHTPGSSPYEFNEENRRATEQTFRAGEIFIITLGLSEVWFNKSTGEVYSTAIPRSIFNESKHGFRVSTVAENVGNLSAIYALIRRHTPRARVILTLSPIPLIATFRPVSCVSANAVSKAILRVAVDETMRANADDKLLHYWPSYELVTEAFRDSLKPDNRHVREEVLSFIMTLFEQIYCTEGPSDDEVFIRYFDAATASGTISKRLTQLIDAPDESAVNRVASRLSKGNIGEATLLLRRFLIERKDAPRTSALLETLNAKSSRMHQSRQSAAH